jgi:hypothetical protein
LEPPESFRPETGHQGFFSTQLPIRVSSLGAETRHSDQFAAFYKSERFLIVKIAPGRHYQPHTSVLGHVHDERINDKQVHVTSNRPTASPENSI